MSRSYFVTGDVVMRLHFLRRANCSNCQWNGMALMQCTWVPNAFLAE